MTMKQIMQPTIQMEVKTTIGPKLKWEKDQIESPSSNINKLHAMRSYLPDSKDLPNSKCGCT